MIQVADRAEAVLQAGGQRADTRAASGRYRRSPAIRAGVRYWASSRLRQREDLFGVQFHGREGKATALRLQAAFERAGFETRNPETSKVTFARAIPFGAGDGVDAESIRSAKSTIDAILGGEPPPSSGRSFREFMLASPWADIEIELPVRRHDPARDIDL